MWFELEFAKGFDKAKTIIAEPNFQNFIIHLLLIIKSALWLKLEKIDKSCTINNYRWGISSVQASVEFLSSFRYALLV